MNKILINGDMLDGEKLRFALEATLSKAEHNVIFISAYVTQSAIDWMVNHLPKGIKGQIVCRLLPFDIMSGASQLSALKTAIISGFDVYCLHSLHAKIYCVDQHTIYAGSANLTNNGLKIYGQGNLEASIQVSPSQNNLDFIKNILSSATLLDNDCLQKMQACIDLKEEELFFDRWPDGVLHEEEGIWVRDFFWGQPGANLLSLEHIHDLEIMGIDSFDLEFPVLKKQISNVRCIRWLIKILKESENNELFFGSITQALHDELKDDPIPYRKDVKTLIQNMLSYCEIYMRDRIEITRPNYSQKIRLLMAG